MNTQKRKYTQVKAKSLRRKQRKKALGVDSSYEKEFTYRGYNIEEIRQMKPEEQAELYTSGVRRKLLRGFDSERQRTIDKICKSTKNVRTHFRDLPVTVDMVGKQVDIYNGKTFVPVVIKEEMLGRLLGEFACGRTFPKHVRKGVGSSRGTSHTALK